MNYSNNSEYHEEEYRLNMRKFGIVFIICFSFMITAIAATFFFTKWIDKLTEYRLKDVDFTINSHQAGDWIPINTCKVKVSDVFTLYDSETEIWMPEDKKIVGIYAEVLTGEHNFDGGITNPYISYGDGYYCLPITDYSMIQLFEKSGFSEEELLSSYNVGNYQDESGYYFFLVDIAADTFHLIIDDTRIGRNQIEDVKVRDVISLNYNEEGGELYE